MTKKRNDALEVQKFYAYCSDAAIALADPSLNPEGRILLLIDVSGFGLRNFDLAGAKALFGMMARHYVERVGRIYLCGAGCLLMKLYRLVTPFIDPVTRGKIVFLPHCPAESARLLSADVDPALLPPSVGGRSEAVPVEEAWREILGDGGSRWRRGGGGDARGGSASLSPSPSPSPSPSIITSIKSL